MVQYNFVGRSKTTAEYLKYIYIEFGIRRR